MMQFDAPAMQRLIDYAAGECSLEHKVAMEAWLDTEPAARHALAELERLYGAAKHRAKPNIDVAARVRAVSGIVSESKIPVKGVYSGRSLPRWVGYGAVAAFVIAVGSVAFKSISRTDHGVL